jgi:hypothetical protein
VSLATHGIVDLYLERLAARVAARGCGNAVPIDMRVADAVAALAAGDAND